MATQTDNTISRKKKIAFKLFSFLLVLILLIFIEVILRVASVGKNLNLFIKHPHPEYKNYYQVNKDIGYKYFNTFDATGSTNDIFKQKKSKNGYRVFVLGSSTVVGFPYNKNLMFSRILKERIQDTYPTKEIEIVNTAITAINTITLKDYIREVIKYDPDAILIYAGHNEFYGAYGIGSNETMSRSPFLQKLHFRFIKLRSYQLLQRFIKSVSGLFSKSPDLANQKGSLMKRIVKDKDIEFGSEKYFVGINQYTDNLESILKEARDNKIDVFIGTLVSNTKDLPPFGKNKDAHTQYNKGLKAFNNNDTLLAYELLTKAKDLDPVRFRASEDINDTIKRLATKYGCTLVDVQNAFENASAGQIVGNNLLTEHVHPNIEGQFLIAETFYQGIVESKKIDIETNHKYLYGKQYYRNNWPYTELDSVAALLRVNQLKSYWPFKELGHNKTFIEQYIPKTQIDSQAYYCIIKPNINEEIMHDSLADLFFSNEDYINASIEFDVLTKLNPSWYKYYEKAANCHLQLNDLHRAERNLIASTKLIDTYFSHLMLAEINLYKLNVSLATEHYLACKKLAKNNDEELMALQGLYRIYKHTDDNELTKVVDALHKLDYTIPENSAPLAFEYSSFIPNNIAQYITEAINFRTAEQPDSALVVLHQALKVNDCPLVNKTIGDLLYQAKSNQLLYYYQKAYDDYQYEPNFLVSYVIAHYVNKDLNGAEEVLSQLTQIAPENTEIKKLENLLNKKKR